MGFHTSFVLHVCESGVCTMWEHRAGVSFTLLSFSLLSYCKTLEKQNELHSFFLGQRRKILQSFFVSPRTLLSFSQFSFCEPFFFGLGTSILEKQKIGLKKTFFLSNIYFP